MTSKTYYRLEDFGGTDHNVCAGLVDAVHTDRIDLARRPGDANLRARNIGQRDYHLARREKNQTVARERYGARAMALGDPEELAYADHITSIQFHIHSRETDDKVVNGS